MPKTASKKIFRPLNSIKFFPFLFLIFFFLISCDKKPANIEKKYDTRESINQFLDDYFLDRPAKKTFVENFKYQLINGKNEELADNKGKIIFLNFWATWCFPCKKEMPDFEEIKKLMEGENFRILAVSFSEPAKKVKDFLKIYPYSFDVIVDPDNKIGSKLNISGLPTTLILDKNLEVLATAVGPRRWKNKDFVHFLKQISK